MLVQSLKLIFVVAVVGISVGVAQPAGTALAHKIPSLAAIFAAGYAQLSSEPASLILLGSGLLFIRRIVARKVHS